MTVISRIEFIAAKSDKANSGNWLSFTVHSRDTAGIMQRLFLKWISDSMRKYISDNLNLSCDIYEREDKACDFCRLTALLHDIGKLTSAFQKKIAPNIQGYYDLLEENDFDLTGVKGTDKFSHSLAGQAILSEYGFEKEIAVLIGAHHGRASYGNNDNIEYNPERYFGKSNINQTQWKTIWNEWIDYSLKKCGFSSIQDLPKPNVKAQMIISGLLIMSDWIASNTDYFPLMDISRFDISEEESRKRTNSAWKKLSLPPCWTPDKENNKDVLFKNRFGYYTPNEVQSAVMDIALNADTNGILIVEAQMGMGKTEAALLSAEITAAKFGNGGIFFGLPTQATANAMFGRVMDWIKAQGDDEKHTVRLAHGMTDLNEEYKALFHGKACDCTDDNIIVHEWFEGKKQALLADFTIATVDWLLAASLKQNHVMLRHLGLAGKVVIIDECHAYDAYMNVYLDNTLRWMGEYKVPVIILSATLPQQRRNELICAYLGKKNIQITEDKAYPLLTWTNGDEVMQKSVASDTGKKKITVTKIDESELTAYLESKLSHGGCCAVIVNTVGYAQKLYEFISQSMPEKETICFHSRFIATDRAEIEKNLIVRVGKRSTPKDRNGLIVVGTQVMEQSLDLDFDFMVTELCPIDLLLQRSGRLHRHDKERPDILKNAQLVILNPNENKSDKIYSKWILMRSEKYLPDTLVIPQCIPDLINKVYSEPESEDEKNCAQWKEYCMELSNKKSNAKKYCIESDRINSKRTKTIANIIDDNAGDTNKAEVAVRDGDETVEVLVMQKRLDGRYCFLPHYNGGMCLDTNSALSEEEAIALARQRIKLPYFLSKYHFKELMSELDVIPKRWIESHWLKGELLLLLNENLSAQICGVNLVYSKKYGIKVKDEEGK